MALNIVALTDRPELAPAVPEWLLDEFRHALSPSHDEQVVALYLMHRLAHKVQFYCTLFATVWRE
jgi:hypothetical protein